MRKIKYSSYNTMKGEYVWFLMDIQFTLTKITMMVLGIVGGLSLLLLSLFSSYSGDLEITTIITADKTYKSMSFFDIMKWVIL